MAEAAKASGKLMDVLLASRAAGDAIDPSVLAALEELPHEQVTRKPKHAQIQNAKTDDAAAQDRLRTRSMLPDRIHSDSSLCI